MFVVSEKVLIIDDEMHIVELLRFNLETSGYKTIYSYDGFDGFIKAKEEKPDLILLDWMLPNISGIEVLKKIRQDADLKKIPVIMLTAKNMEDDKVEGLEVGADDYITKPFSIKELLARITSVMRRYGMNTGKESEELTAGNLKLNLTKHEVKINDKKVDLTLKEFELLKLLLKNRGKVLSRNFLLDEIWGYEYYGETRTVDVHIRYLRKKLEEAGADEKYIETIRGVGYKID
ncbi:response regulator receiver domain protein [Peptacetobacter hiranonis DSM 13275]|uniref:Stage 0 sporulation protein A homolog n=1 Tax=Peptacetobacter hiranonis (strain DSM 13275 / JCM 10541 / KCTC 15199 / TO-931) TaxID=500633 RepID=B6FYV2_PEPHT|nr:response regulator receiver domain protein [Peptacetobacter hiranonis DSM 13275]QEK20351.1 Alkaline phosphatase synthesis transcriptional regulatory protein PhoP [Peptacetobacter hiranonis]